MNPDIARKALVSLVGCINAIGGIVCIDGQFFAPVIDLDWTDLGDAYIQACQALGIEPVIKEI